MELVEEYLKRKREPELICPLQSGREAYTAMCLQGKCAVFDRRTGKCSFLSIAQSLSEKNRK